MVEMQSKSQAAGPRPVDGQLSVGVLVDLHRGIAAGGHVKCWERLAEAAAGEDLDLTVYFLGKRAQTETLADNVRYVLVRPLLGTEMFPFLDLIAAHTDLAPMHPGVLDALRRHQVLHATDAYFSLARTALFVARKDKRPLVNSIHTDTPGYTRVYSSHVLQRIFGDGRLGRLVREQWRWQDRLAAGKQRQLERYIERCDWTMDAQENDAATSLPVRERWSVLRRGIDKEFFHPARRNRKRLKEEFGIGEDRLVLLFAGRVDQGKDVMTLARAARILADRGVPIHAVFAGEGSQQEKIGRLLGDRASLPGTVTQNELAWLYASADLFVFPSQIEISPNVVLEAKASGLPALVSGIGGSRRMIREPGRDGIVVESADSFVWAEAIEALWNEPARRATLGAQARRSIETEWPSWRDVLREDLLPVWKRVARERGLWGELRVR